MTTGRHYSRGSTVNCVLSFPVQAGSREVGDLDLSSEQMAGDTLLQ